MNETIRMQLESAGVNVEDVWERLMGNMTLISKFFSRFPEDKNFEKLKAAMNKKDWDEAFRAAHTLKGVCANLAMTALYEAVSKQVEYLRESRPDEAAEFMPELEKIYENTVDAISAIQWSGQK